MQYFLIYNENYEMSIKTYSCVREKKKKWTTVLNFFSGKAVLR